MHILAREVTVKCLACQKIHTEGDKVLLLISDELCTIVANEITCGCGIMFNVPVMPGTESEAIYCCEQVKDIIEKNGIGHVAQINLNDFVGVLRRGLDADSNVLIDPIYEYAEFDPSINN